MILKPDLSRKIIDPFTSHNTLILLWHFRCCKKKFIWKRSKRNS
jgi:hypothetical protein